MISQAIMTYHANRTFALTELLDATYEQAYQAVNEGTNDPDTVIERLKNLLFCAHEIAHNLAGDLDGLIDKAGQAVAPTPGLAQVGNGLHSLKLNNLTCDVLHRNGISSVGQLAGMTMVDLIGIPGVGKKTIADIEKRLAANGLSLSVGAAL